MPPHASPGEAVLRIESWWSPETRIEIELLRKYTETMEDALRDINDHFHRRMEQARLDYTYRNPQVLDDLYADERWMVQDVFPARLRAFTFVQAMSLFEYELMRLCNALGRDCKLEREFPRRSPGSTLEKIRSYLDENLGVDLGSDPEWEVLGVFSAIRNAIVHNHSRLPDGEKAQGVLNYAHAHPHLVTIGGDGPSDTNGVYLKEGLMEVVMRSIGAVLNRLGVTLRQMCAKTDEAL